MAARFWDMDHTLCDNDCDVSWKQFLIATGRVPAATQELVDRFYRDYEQNRLDPEAFLAFQLAEFVGQTPAAMQALAHEHFESVVRPLLYDQAVRLVRQQLDAGDFVCLLTATNTVIAAPLATHLGFRNLLATELELRNGRYTGRREGTYVCGEGKLARLGTYCAERGIALADVHYYGDGLSDQYVLGRVGHPTAVNPMPELRALATANGWPVLDFPRHLRRPPASPS